MNDKDIFDEACKEFGFGRRLDIENYPHVPAAPAYERARIIAQDLIDSARSFFPSLPAIHFDFSDSGEVNAVAFKRQDKYFIGLTAGAMTMFLLLIYRMLATPTVFPNIGKPGLEKIHLPSINWQILNGEKQFNSGTRPILPQCHKREAYARHLIEQGLLFVIGHEIAHITRGHVDYLNAKRGISLMSELGWRGDSDKRLERQVLEADADKRSVFARCHSALGTHALNSNEVPIWVDKPLSRQGIQFDWAFAVSAFFRLFGDKQFTKRNLEEESYPPFSLRLRIATEYAMSYLHSKWGDDNWKSINDVFASSVRMAEQAFQRIGADPSPGGIASATSPESVAHLQLLREYWDRLKDNLQEFSYENL